MWGDRSADWVGNFWRAKLLKTTIAMNLTTKYLGLTLKNPLIVSSSGLTSSIEKLRAAAAAGAGAVVLKSIFEEQLTQKAGSLEAYTDYPEAADYLRGYVASGAMDDYLTLIRKAKAELTIPIIASINCSTSGDWVTYAKQIESAGADALELNIFVLPTNPDEDSEAIEARYLEVAATVRAGTELPISVKLPQGFTNPLYMIRQLYYRGIKGVVLFNRFYSPDIDLNKMAVVSGGVFSSPADLYAPLRWTALASDKTPLIDVAVSSGVHSGQAALKALLSGAKAVEVCSVLYDQGVDYLQTMLVDMERWLADHQYPSVESIVGKLNAKQEKDAVIFERAQFMKYFSALKG